MLLATEFGSQEKETSTALPNSELHKMRRCGSYLFIDVSMFEWQKKETTKN